MTIVLVDDEDAGATNRSSRIGGPNVSRSGPSIARKPRSRLAADRSGGCEILNRMVQHQGIDRSLSAISDPTRRRILERLGAGSATIGELAEPFGISLTGMRKHVQVLEDAGLVVTERIGRTRICTLGPERLDDVDAWIADYRRLLEKRLERLVKQLKQSRR
jgi:DNA-binding transcriptional ArsR family regulator